jgi:DNA-binding response OmpR family regulator
MGTALIIEDDPDQATVVSHLLQMRGYRAQVCYNGQDGLRMARRHPPQVIVLDVMLPDIDGFDVCRRLRGDPATRTTPIVMVTALAGPPDRRRGYRVGANYYVPKPYSPTELFGAIEHALQWKAALERGKVLGEIQIELPSEASLLAEVNEFLTGICRETPLTCDQIAQLRQSIMEMGQNAIEWGNRHLSEALVRVTYRTYDDRVEVVIRDEGAGFNPHKIDHAACADDPVAHMDVREKLGLREGGFGLMISRGMLDELRYNGRGNEVTLVKRFHSMEVASEI